MITVEEAQAQADALAEAASCSPIEQIAQPLRVRAKEWAEAAEHLAEATTHGEDVEIVLAGSLEPGMAVYVGGQHAGLIRMMDQPGRLSLHVQYDQNGRENYVTVIGGRSAPVLILRRSR